MKRTVILAALISLVMHAASAAEPETATPQTPVWVEAQAHLNAAIQDVSVSGIHAVAKYVPQLQETLKTGVPVMRYNDLGNGHIVVLADGTMQALLSLAPPDDAAPVKGTVSVIPTPYLMISLLLGSYYNEIGKSSDALDVLNLGIGLSDIKGMGVGDHDSKLLSEKSVALNALKRFDESLANNDIALALQSLRDSDRALLLRGRGYVLTELGRLDEAEKAYQRSLICEPGNALARNELTYIAQLRAGKSATPGQMMLRSQSPEAASDTTQCSKA